MTSRRRAGVGGIVALSLLLFLTSCQSAFDWDETSPSPAPSDLVGEWEAHSAQQQISRLEFANDGTVVVTDMPHAASFLKDGTPDAWSDTSGGMGTWTVDAKSPGVWDVNLAYEGGFTQLTTVDGGDGLQLFTEFTDPDLHERVTFSRVDH